jgi:ATPase family AAA domain-containing protein 3A/B
MPQSASLRCPQVLEVTRQQEIVKLQESKEREADFKRQAAMFAKDQEAVRWEEQRKTMAEEGQRQAQLAQYQDELARKRLGQEHELQRQRNAEMVALQEQSSVKREQERLRVEQQIQAERRAAEQYASELAKQVEREKAIAGVCEPHLGSGPVLLHMQGCPSCMAPWRAVQLYLGSQHDCSSQHDHAMVRGPPI